jgi:polynucleotide 5'-kinase involved in rRNA processing
MSADNVEQETATTSHGAENPTVVLVIGMAGSGKTTLMGRIKNHLVETNVANYLINLDPAVLHLSYEPNIDVRDTVR